MIVGYQINSTSICNPVETSDSQNLLQHKNTAPLVTVEDTNIVFVDTNIKQVSKLDVVNVGEVCDMSFTDFQKTEKNENSNTVEIVHGKLQGNTEDNFSDSGSEYESDSGQKENSVAYIANYVEKVDALNFDDSDVSIVEEDYEELI